MIESRRLATNIIVGWVANLVKVIVQLIMLPLMARFLGPAEMGLYSLAMPIISLVMPLTDAGLGQSLAREKLDNHPVWSTAFWLLQIIGVLLAFGIIGGSYAVAIMAKQPRLPMVMIVLATIFPLVACAVLPAARLTQKGNLIAGPIIDMTSNVLGAFIGAYFAYAAFGVWAMVAQYISVFVFRTSLFNFVEFYIPRLMFNLRALGGHMQLGGAITGSKLVEFGGRIVENSIVSRSLGSAALGTYGFASQVSRFLSEAVSNSIWANLYYASLYGEGDASINALLKLTRVLGLILFPLSCLAAALAPTALPVLLGHKWELAGWPLTLLCVAAPYVVIGNMTAAVLYAKGRGGIPFWTSTLSTIARVAAIFIFSPYGIIAACAAIAVLSILQYVISFFVTQRSIGHHALAVLGNLAWPIVASFVGFAAVLYILLHYEGYVAIGVAGVAFAAIYVLVQVLFDRRRFIADCAGIITLAFKKRTPVSVT